MGSAGSFELTFRGQLATGSDPGNFVGGVDVGKIHSYLKILAIGHATTSPLVPLG